MSDFDAEALARKHGLPTVMMSDLQSGTQAVANIAALNEAFAAGRDSGMKRAAEILRTLAGAAPPDEGHRLRLFADGIELRSGAGNDAGT